MATGSGWYNKALNSLAAAGINLGSADVRCMLVQSSYTPDVDAHEFVADISASEVTVGGYGRVTCTGETLTRDDANDRQDFSLDNAAFTSLVAGETIGKAVIFVQVTNDADSILLGYIGFTNTPTNGGDFTVKWNNGSSSGVALRLSNSPT